MYQQVLKILHAEDKSVLSGLAYTTDDSVELALHVSSKETDFSKCIQIDNNVFVWSNTKPPVFVMKTGGFGKGGTY